eukprot:TRINITY_DN25462_c0_g1_i1.p1 TRINITY_DN25462_c0_g1~~TRINITY_DN25462_c0_g1_i1.p1  ORF type:complete len:282 (-),score=20.11 TRINITY_DN25462_c0_g1_i1:67-912(-)
MLPRLGARARGIYLPVAIAGRGRAGRLAWHTECPVLFDQRRRQTPWWSPMMARLVLIIADLSPHTSSRLWYECRILLFYVIPGTLSLSLLFIAVRLAFGIERFHWLAAFIPITLFFVLLFLLTWAGWRLAGSPISSRADVYTLEGAFALLFFFAFILPLRLNASADRDSNWFSVLIPLFMCQLIVWMAPLVLYKWANGNSRINSVVKNDRQLIVGWLALTLMFALVFAGEIRLASRLEGLSNASFLPTALLFCPVFLYGPVWTLLDRLVWPKLSGAPAGLP